MCIGYHQSSPFLLEHCYFRANGILTLVKTYRGLQSFVSSASDLGMELHVWDVDHIRKTIKLDIID